MITQEIIDKIRFLQNRIKKNLATIEDYNEYQRILISYGMKENYFEEYLKKEALMSYSELIVERRKFEQRKRDKNIETIVVAGLIGLGIAVIINAINETRK